MSCLCVSIRHPAKLHPRHQHPRPSLLRARIASRRRVQRHASWQNRCDRIAIAPPTRKPTQQRQQRCRRHEHEARRSAFWTSRQSGACVHACVHSVRAFRHCLPTHARSLLLSPTRARLPSLMYHNDLHTPTLTRPLVRTRVALGTLIARSGCGPRRGVKRKQSSSCRGSSRSSQRLQNVRKSLRPDCFSADSSCAIKLTTTARGQRRECLCAPSQLASERKLPCGVARCVDDVNFPASRSRVVH